MFYLQVDRATFSEGRDNPAEMEYFVHAAIVDD